MGFRREKAFDNRGISIMKNRTILLLICILFVWLMPQASRACSTFLLDQGDQPMFGKNFDWNVPDGLVFVNKRHVSKTAMQITRLGQPAANWTSKYGSVTFNQLGREEPFGGINEVGLVIEMMELPGTDFPSPDSRSAILSLQWIQYQLDNFRTVEEVISSDSQIRIFTLKRNLTPHYLVCDTMGNCASIEFIDGKLVFHTQETMPVKALTNSKYSESLKYLKKHSGFGGKFPISDSGNSMDRFVRAANLMKNYDAKTSKSAIQYAFDILKHLENSTLWSIVYDIGNLRAYFRTYTNHQIRYINLKSFDFSCSSPVQVLDINANLSGDVTNKFFNYTKKINRNLIENANYKSDRYNLPSSVIDSFSEYPETTICNE
jgi:choloylglycine hydrolase